MQVGPEIMPKNDALASLLHPEIGKPEAGTALGSHMQAQPGGKARTTGLYSFLLFISTFLQILCIYLINFTLANIASFSSKPSMKKKGHFPNHFI